MNAYPGKIAEDGVLQSPRLVLTRPRADDFVDCVRMWADTSTSRFMGGKPMSGEQVWSRLLRHVGHWEVLGFGFWILRDRVTGAFVGEAGFYELKRDLEPSPGNWPETGWVLAPDARGKGLAREAVKAILAWGDRHFATTRTICLIDPRNTPSMGVALDCGYERTGDVRHQGNALVLLERNVTSGIRLAIR